MFQGIYHYKAVCVLSNRYALEYTAVRAIAESLNLKPFSL